VAGEWNPAEPTSLPLRCHVGKAVKCLCKAATSLAEGGCETTKPPHAHPLVSRTLRKLNCCRLIVVEEQPVFLIRSISWLQTCLTEDTESLPVRRTNTCYL